MKKLHIATLIAIFLITSCTSKFDGNKVKNSESLNVWVSNDTLFIDNFKYSDASTGAFKALNEKVYSELLQKSETYKIIEISKDTDKYGIDSNERLYKGLVDANEINKFKNIDYWIDSGGIQDNIVKNKTTVTFASDFESSLITISEYRADNTSDTEALITHLYGGMIDKKWAYYVQAANKFVPITSEYPSYSDVSNLWKDFINDIQDIQVKANSLQAEMTIITKDEKKNLTLKREKGYYITNAGDFDIVFETYLDNSCSVSFTADTTLITVSNKPVTWR